MLDKHLLLMEEALALEDVLAKQRHCHQAHHHHHQQHRQDAHHPLLRGVGRDLNQGTNKEKDDMHVLLPSPHGLILPLARAHCHTGHTQQAQQTHVVMPKAEEASPLRLQRPCGRLGEGDVLTSTVSNSAYLVLKTMAQAEGHCRPQASLFLAMPLRFPHVATLSAASASRVVLKVISRASLWPESTSPSPPPPPLQQPQQQQQHLDRPLGESAALHLLSQVNGGHANVMTALEMMADDTYIFLVFPYAEDGDLFEAVAKTNTGLPEEEARGHFFQVVQGLCHLKKYGLAHGDVSLENVVMCRSGADGGVEENGGSGSSGSSGSSSSSSRSSSSSTCRLIDLEMSRYVAHDDNQAIRRRALYGLRNVGGKKGYIAPECVNGTVMDWHAADIWSLGICLYTMLTRHPLYLDTEDLGFAMLCQGSAPDVLQYYANEYGLHVPALAMDLITSMLRPVPDQRPTLEECLQHPWLCPSSLDSDATTATLASLYRSISTSSTASTSSSMSSDSNLSGIVDAACSSCLGPDGQPGLAGLECSKEITAQGQ